MRHRNLEREMRRDEEENIDEILQGIKERHRRQVRYNTEGDQVPQRLLMPGVEDPSLWQVRVKLGRERAITASIFRKVFKSGIPVISVFYRDSLPGLIYLEARQSADVNSALQGIVGVYLSRGIQLVPIEEMAPLLRIKKKEINLTPGMWVRLKRGKHTGDLAQIIDVDQLTSGVVGVKFVPRIDMTPREKKTERLGNGKGGLGGNFRPPQKLFNYEEVRRVYGKQNVRHGQGNSFIFDGDEYIDGFCYKDMKIALLTTEDVQPTLEEVSTFSGEDATGRIDLSTIADANRNISASFLTPGDQVEVFEGELTGILGKVETIEGDTISIKAIGGEIHGQVVEVPARSVRKKFDVGEHVKITNGKNANVSGMIVDVNGDVVTLMSDQGQQEIKVFSKDVRKAADVASGSSATVAQQQGLYEPHELVMLDSTTAGVITKVEGSMLRVLDQNGMHRTVSTNEVTLRRDNARYAVATDSTGAELRCGDKMKETDGENRRGEVINISRSIFVFLHNREYPENNGVFVARATSLVSLTPKASTDLTKQNPALNAQLHQMNLMPPPQSVGNRRIINTPVVVTRGTYKGLLGTIKDVVGAAEARVELATNNKTITIQTAFLKRKDPKTGATYPLETGNFGSGGGGGGRGGYGGGGGGYDTYNGGGRTVNPYGGATPGGQFGRTPNPYSSGYGKTPNPYASSGGKTPGWGAGGKTPAPGWSGGGGKTPGWAGGGGKTPAWGGAGGKTPAPQYGGDGGRTPAPSWSGGGGGKTPNPYASAPTPAAYNDPGTSRPISAPTPGAYGGAAFSAPTPGAALSAPTPAPAGGFSAPTPYSAPTPGAGLSAPTPGVFAAPTPGAGLSAPTPAVFGAPTPFAPAPAGVPNASGIPWDWALDFRNVLVTVGPSQRPGSRNPRHFQRGFYDGQQMGIESTVNESVVCRVLEGGGSETLEIPAEYLQPVRPDGEGQEVIVISGDPAMKGQQRRTAYRNDQQWMMEQAPSDMMALVMDENDLARIWHTE